MSPSQAFMARARLGAGSKPTPLDIGDMRARVRLLTLKQTIRKTLRFLAVPPQVRAISPGTERRKSALEAPVANGRDAFLEKAVPYSI